MQLPATAKPFSENTNYYVDTNGDIYSCVIVGSHSKHGNQKVGEWKKLSLSKCSPKGHKGVKVRQPNGSRKFFSVHYMVLTTFVGPRPPKMMGCHWNGDPSDNRLENLRWDTQKGNSADDIRNGVTNKGKFFYYLRGEKHPRNKLTEQDVIQILLSVNYETGRIPNPTYRKLLADKFGVSISTIEAIIYRRIWKHVPIPTSPCHKEDLSGIDA